MLPLHLCFTNHDINTLYYCEPYTLKFFMAHGSMKHLHHKYPLHLKVGNDTFYWYTVSSDQWIALNDLRLTMH